MALFYGGEIVDMAIEMERIGFKFYNALAEHASDDEARAMFQWLASEERNHERDFEKLREQVSAYSLSESYPGEWQAYVNALIEARTVLGDENINQLAASVNFSEAIRVGMRLEKDSILFYEALIEYVPKSEQKVVEEIIAQEKRHLRRLADLLKEFQG